MSRKEWNYTPDLPLRVAPLWRSPFSPWAVFRWYFDSWFPVSFNLVIVGLAFASWTWFAPTLDAAATPGGWIFTVWARNLVLAFVLAHSLHLVLHGYRWQGDKAKFDPRPYPRKGRVFAFGDQLKDNMAYAILSGVTIWTAWECVILWSMANGYAPVWTWNDGAVWFVAAFFLIPIWESFYFYWMHRAIHHPWLYRFHAVHHRNTDVGPWSGLSMHPVEHLMYFGTAIIHFVVPTHPVHLIAHLMFFALYAITTHTGFEGLWIRDKKRIHLGNFHHQLHHRYFECNYGTREVPWDLWFGSWHDGTPEAHEAMKARRRGFGTGQ